jgi:hypothetical protein
MLANVTRQYVKNGAQRRLKKHQQAITLRLPRTGTGGREYETGATYRVMDDAEPSCTDLHRDGCINPVHYPAKPR